MVDMTPEQVMAMKAGKPVDILDAVDRAVVGSSGARLTMPLDHPVAMAERADLLIGLGNRLKAIAGRSDLSIRTVMSEYRTEVRAMQRRFDEMGVGSSRVMRVVK